MNIIGYRLCITRSIYIMIRYICTCTTIDISTCITTIGWCSCSECVTAAESVSYCKPIISEPLRGLSACTRCDHYRNVGHFKDQHEKNKCNVPASEIRVIKYQGWCSCDRCVSLATERGYQQPLKLRKSSS